LPDIAARLVTGPGAKENSMTINRILAPDELAVSMETARATARFDGNAMDAEIAQAIRTYTDEAEHYTGRAIIEQTWEVTLDRFPTGPRGSDGAFVLPRPPLISVVHIKFYDGAGQLQMLDPQDYQVDIKSAPGYIVPAPGKSWPTSANRINAVEVQYKCGYGTDHSSVPDGIKGFIMAKIAEHFAPVGTPKNEYADRLLWRAKVFY
jgi:uncharacterized phiE125 gp8 family phage protein